jgi:hypothetical protein
MMFTWRKTYWSLEVLAPDKPVNCEEEVEASNNR